MSNLVFSTQAFPFALSGEYPDGQVNVADTGYQATVVFTPFMLSVDEASPMRAVFMSELGFVLS